MKDDLIAAAQRALEVLEELQGGCTDSDDGTVEAITVWCPQIITALRAALEAPEPKPLRTARESMKTEGWRQCAVGQRETQHCGLLETAVLAEREACARVCEGRANGYQYATDPYAHEHITEANYCAAAIRARGDDEPR